MKKASLKPGTVRALKIIEIILTVIMNLAFVFHFIAVADTFKDGLVLSVVSSVVLLLEYSVVMVPCLLLLLIIILLNVFCTRLFGKGFEICGAAVIAFIVAEYFLIFSLSGVRLGIVLLISAVLPNVLLVFECFSFEKYLAEKKKLKKD
ncbi:MAG: hypothetical protein MJ137_05400 [Clostridia bacterium]|nr:hypothetical protein [Clostridia bacterium]